MQTRMRMVLLVGAALVCAALAGIAGADNPHGTPPGQAPSGQAAGSSAAQPSSPPGQAKKQQEAAANAQPVTSDNSSGVKPSSTTAHNTVAVAGSNKTKQYGNGKTAGEIAIQNGASLSTVLLGPGNSQPHKVAVCVNGKTHYVDVHALKSHQAGACAAVSAAVSGSSNATIAPAAGNAGASAKTGLTVSGRTSSLAARSGVLAAQKTVSRAAARRTTHRALVARKSAGPAHVLGAQAVKRITHRAAPAHAVVAAAHFTG